MLPSIFMATFGDLQEKAIHFGQNPEKMERVAKVLLGENPEEMKRAAKVLGELALSIVPFLWLPDIKKGFENARTYSDLLFYTSLTILFTTMDVADLATLGTSAIAFTSAKMALRKAANEFTKILVENGVEKEVAEQLARDAIKTAEKELADVGEFAAKQKYVINEIVKKENIKTPQELVKFFKDQFIKKEESVLYKILNGPITELSAREAQEGRKIILELEKTDKIGIGIVDKGSTWFLNGLSPELGDAGLSIYMKNLLESARNHKVKLIMTGADEVVVIAMEGGEETIKKFFASVKEGMRKDIQQIKNSLPENSAVSYFEDALEAISLHTDTAIPKVINGEVKIASKHSPKRFVTLSEFTSSMETRELFKLMPSADVERLRPFTNLKGPVVESVSTPSGVIAVRLGFDEATNNSLRVLTEKAGKGTAQTLVENGIGPSVINLLGHPAADYFTHMYAQALKRAFEEAGKGSILVKVGQTGAPLSIGYVLKDGAKLSEKEIGNITQRANEIFVGMITKEHPELGLVGAKAVSGPTKQVVEQKLFNEATKGLSELFQQSRSLVDEIGASVVVLHTPGLKQSEITRLVNHLSSISGINKMEIDQVRVLLNNTPKWVRKPEDLFIYLKTNNINIETINSVMGFFGGMSVW
jgi:hypothetical protein